jgi:hypothetical protein
MTGHVQIVAIIAGKQAESHAELKLGLTLLGVGGTSVAGVTFKPVVETVEGWRTPIDVRVCHVTWLVLVCPHKDHKTLRRRVAPVFAGPGIAGAISASSVFVWLRASAGHSTVVTSR